MTSRTVSTARAIDKQANALRYLTQVSIAGRPIFSCEALGLPSVNTHYNKHYKSRANDTKRWRELGESIALDFTFDLPKPVVKRALVVVNVFVPTEGICDIHNVHVKPMLDGFTDAGLWVDDEWTFVPLVLFAYAGIGTEFGPLKRGKKRRRRLTRTVLEVFELDFIYKSGHKLRLPKGRTWL